MAGDFCFPFYSAVTGSAQGGGAVDVSRRVDGHFEDSLVDVGPVRVGNYVVGVTQVLGDFGS